MAAMAVTSKSASGLTGTTAAGQTDQQATTAPAEDGKPFDGNCVVDDGTPHTGRATPGAKICSAHAMRYKADGTPR
jgi:hypothetical protein